MIKPVIDFSSCILCGICTDQYPQVFKMNGAVFVEVIDLPDYPVEIVNEAINYCPKDCITWEEG